MRKKVWNRLFVATVTIGIGCFGAIVASERKCELDSEVAKVEHVLSEETLVVTLGQQQDGNVSASAKEAQVVSFTQVTPEPQQVTYVETTPTPTPEPEKVVTVETVEVKQETKKQEASYDSSEIKELYRIVHAESAGEPFTGQMAVAAVILNRVETVGFPNDLCGVIRQNGQFSPVENGEIYFGKNKKVLNFEDVSQSVIEATQMALEGEDPTEALLWKEAERLGLDPEKYAKGGALYFYAPGGDITPEELESREKIKVKVQIEGHVFYKYWDR